MAPPTCHELSSWPYGPYHPNVGQTLALCQQTCSVLLPVSLGSVDKNGFVTSVSFNGRRRANFPTIHPLVIDCRDENRTKVHHHPRFDAKEREASHDRPFATSGLATFYAISRRLPMAPSACARRPHGMISFPPCSRSSKNTFVMTMSPVESVWQLASATTPSHCRLQL